MLNSATISTGITEPQTGMLGLPLLVESNVSSFLSVSVGRLEANVFFAVIPPTYPRRGIIAVLV